MSFLITLVLAFLARFKRRLPFVEPEPADISGKLLCPCFAVDADDDVVGLWGLLGMDERNRDAAVAWVRRQARLGETPMLAFLLSPTEIAGRLFSVFPGALDEAACAAAERFFHKMLAAGVALAPTLYCDDPDGTMPRWWEIRKHSEGWKKLHARLGKYFSAAFLSIETNERATSQGAVEDAIGTLRECFPGLQAYGTHLQWATRDTRYKWIGGNTVPRNADLVLAEAPWAIEPAREGEGDRQGISGLNAWVSGMKNAGVPLGKIVLHEANLRPGGQIAGQQRDAGRKWGVRGVGL